MSEAQNSKMMSLQILRAIAVLLVMFAHSSEKINGNTIISKQAGNFGVDIFFVISGFIMVFISTRRHMGPVDFLRERVTRIVPTYWFYTLLAFAMFLVAPTAFRGTEGGFGHLLLSMLFIAHENPATGSLSPFLRIGWTLNYEMFFYVAFAIAMAVARPLRVPLTTGFLLLLTAIGLSATLGLVDLPPIVRFYTGNLMLEFAFGMGLAWAYLSGRLPIVRPVIAMAVLVAALGLAVGVAQSAAVANYRGIVWGILALLLVCSALSLEKLAARPWLRWAVTIGNASYTLYLLHLFPFSAYRIVWHKLGLPEDSLASQITFQATAIAGVCLLGILAWKWIELPLTAAVRSLLGNHRKNVGKVTP